MKSQKKTYSQIYHQNSNKFIITTSYCKKYGDSSYMLYNDFGNISSSKQLPSFGKGKHKYI